MSAGTEAADGQILTMDSYHGRTCPKSGSAVNFSCMGCKKKKKKAVKWQQAVVLHGIACLERARKLLIQRDREAQEAGGGGKPAPGQRL